MGIELIKNSLVRTFVQDTQAGINLPKFIEHLKAAYKFIPLEMNYSDVNI